MKRKSYVVPQQQVSMFELDTPSMPVFDKSRCVAKLVNYKTAARMVETYHYAHRVPSIVVAVGLFVDEVLAGVCCYGIPPTPNVQRFCGEEYRKNVLELNRLFIFDWVGRNAESWLIGQSFKLIPKEYFILISYADSSYNHLGAIYQATNWLYTGTSTPGSDLTLPNNMHSRTTTHLGGYNAIKNIEGVEMVDRSLKYRYVYFLGPKKQRQLLRSLLKWPILPYPKKTKEFPTR